MTARETAYLQRLIKRRDWLAARIVRSSEDLAYDKAELSALTWAIEFITHALEAE